VSPTDREIQVSTWGRACQTPTRFSLGTDEIALTGSKVKQGEADLILAREVVKGADTLVLRDDKGNPVWNWHR
jgi:hypothetical protein